MVSILVPAYNAGRWIRQCLESALAQEWPQTEVIVVDDGSSDDTASIVRSFGGEVRFVQAGHAGGNAARNALLELARGEWLQYLDADDYLLPHKIADQMLRAGEQPGLDLIYSPVILRDESTGSMQPMPAEEGVDLASLYIRWGVLNTNGFLWRRTSVAAAGGWKLNQEACQEHELVMRMVETGTRFSLVTRPGSVYRSHTAGSVSRKDPLLTIRLQAQLLNRMQSYLARSGNLTARHRKALYGARMAAARTVWKSDRAAAREMARGAKSTGEWWIPSSTALPATFQIAARLFGFANAERLAEWQRSV